MSSVLDKRARIEAFLAEQSIPFLTVTHPPVFHVHEGEEIRRALPGAHTKNLFLKDRRGNLALVSAEQQTRIDLKSLHRLVGCDRFSFGSPERLADTLDVTPGSVTALALHRELPSDFRFVLDRRLADADRVNFHPMTNTATTCLTQSAFRAFLRAVQVTPVIIDFEAGAKIPESTR